MEFRTTKKETAASITPEGNVGVYLRSDGGITLTFKDSEGHQVYGYISSEQAKLLVLNLAKEVFSLKEALNWLQQSTQS